MVSKYIITVKYGKGRRMYGNRTFDTKIQAQNWSKALQRNSSKTNKKMTGFSNPRVKKVEVYSGGDSKQMFFN